MQTTSIHRSAIGALGLAIMILLVSVASAEPAGDTPVHYKGGKRGHIKGCRRLGDGELNTTYAEMKKKCALLCSRCPGSNTPG